MNTTVNHVVDGRRRRRVHSAEFKAQVVAACNSPGVSIAAVAMAHGVNANLARRWVIDSERQRSGSSTGAGGGGVQATFVSLQLPPPAQSAPADIRIELRRGATTISVSWPCTAASQCGAWMRELLR